jgi:hypothetical protein
VPDADVAAYRRDGRVLIVPSYTTGGPWVEGYPLMVLPGDAVAAEIGAAVRFALERSAAGPPGSRSPARPLVLRAAGARGEGQFMRGAEAVDVQREGHRVRVTPMRNLGADAGFDYRSDAEVVLDAPDDETLGAAVRRGWPQEGGDEEGADAGPDDADLPLERDIRRAADWIAEALTDSGYRADFSPSSLSEIDRFFDDQLRKPGRPRRNGLLSEDLGARLFGLGGYAGEVVRRARGGRWDAAGLSDEQEDAVRLVLSDGTVAWPVQRAMKRFQNGAEDALAAWGAGLGLRG